MTFMPLSWVVLVGLIFSSLRNRKRGHLGKRSRSRRITHVAMYISLVYLGLSPCGASYVYSLFLFRPWERTRSRDALAATITDSRVTVYDTVQRFRHGDLRVLTIDNPIGDLDACVLIVPGIAGNAPALSELGDLVRQAGAKEVVLYEPRGFGSSPGLFTTVHSVIEDAADVYQWLRDRPGTKRPVVLFGYSLGTGVVSHLVGHRFGEAKAVILQGAFTDIAAVAYEFPLLRVWNFNVCRAYPPWLFPPELNTQCWLRGHHPPTLLIHGEMDRVVPVHHSNDMYEVARQPIRKIILPHSDHVSISRGEHEQYINGVHAFLKEALAR